MNIKIFENWIYKVSVDTAKIFHFANEIIKSTFEKPSEKKEFLKQIYSCGYKSLPLISLTGFIIGMIVAIQSYPVLSSLGAVIYLPGMVSISVIRELGPVVTALIFAGRVASGYSAELASMKVTEQIDAMEVSGINVTKYLLNTRVMATTLMVPLLSLYSDFLSFIGAYVGMNSVESISFSFFLKKTFGLLKFSDFFPALIKTFFFGFAIGLIACYKGCNVRQGTKGVGKAVNESVVNSSIVIFIIDLIAAKITTLLF